jgi:hypothetical protein
MALGALIETAGNGDEAATTRPSFLVISTL